MPEYKVYVDDNCHFMNEDERYLQGTYDSFEKAVTAARKVIDDFFAGVDIGKLTEEQLFSGWSHYGDNPFIVTDDKRSNCDKVESLKTALAELEGLSIDNPDDFLSAFDRGYNPPAEFFSASDYARQRCREFCWPKSS